MYSKTRPRDNYQSTMSCATFDTDCRCDCVNSLRYRLRQCFKYERSRTTYDSYYIVPDYMTSVQMDKLNVRHRSVLLNWMFDVVGELTTKRESGIHWDTFALALNLLDRYLSTTAVRLNDLQLMGTACLFTALKVKGDFEIETKWLVRYTNNSITEKQLVDTEAKILDKLKWLVDVPTSYDYFTILLHMGLQDGSIKADAFRRILRTNKITRDLSILTRYRPLTIALGMLLIEASEDGGIVDVISRFVEVFTEIERDRDTIMTQITPKEIRDCSEALKGNMPPPATSFRTHEKLFEQRTDLRMKRQPREYQRYDGSRDHHQDETKSNGSQRRRRTRGLPGDRYQRTEKRRWNRRSRVGRRYQ